MPNTGVNPIRRAAGVILWHLEHQGEPQAAIAKASAREPRLTDDELRYALCWAMAARRYRDLAQQATRKPKLSRDERGGLVMDYGPEGRGTKTIGEIIDESGLRPFLKDYRDGTI